MQASPIVWTQASKGVASLVSATPKVGQDPSLRQWDLVLTSDLKAREEVEALTIFPSGGSYYNAAVEEVAAADVKIRPLKGQSVHLDFAVIGDDDKPVTVLQDMPGEVRFVKLKANTNVRIHQARIRLHGVSVDDSNAIVGMMGHAVQVEVKPDQGSLPMGTKGDPNAPERGQLVSGKTKDDQAVVGIMTKSARGKPIVDDFGVLHTLTHVASTMWIESADKEDVADHMDRYKAGAEEAKATPTWACLMEAILLTANAKKVKPPSGGKSWINGDVVDRAIAMHSADELPSEAV